MKYERTVDVPASAAATWAVVEDVESWPTWVATFEAVDLKGPLQVGTEAAITQPGRGTLTYSILELEPGRRFVWGRRKALVDQWADHVVEPTGPDTSRVTLVFWMSGPLGGPASWLAGRAIRRMVDTEAESLVRRLSAP
jgi:carbon monoxide dehydrogenase subunit G